MLVSILMSVHNEEEYIQKCLESIENQSYKQFEVVIVDDRCNDKTMNIVKKWKKNIDQNVMIITNKKNLGLTKSLNIGLKKCSGDVIARIDADDWWLKDKLKEQVSFFEKNSGYGYIGTNFINHFESSGKQKTMLMREEDVEIRKNAFQKNPFAHSTLMIRKSLLEKVDGYDNKVKRGQDYDLFLRCLPLTKFYNIQKILCHRLIPKKSISVKSQKEQATQSMKTKIKYIKKYGASINNYKYLIEPFLNAYTPNVIKNLKRKFL